MQNESTRSDAMRVLTEYYGHYDEEGRLASRYGSVEFLTTVRYIDQYLANGGKTKILEIGAGTGRYSHYFARLGYTVDAIELIEHNIDIFRQNTEPGESITIRQGDAVDLSCISDNTYDLVLLLGPMYHLFTEEDRKAALREAVRVTKPGGKVFVSYCMNEPTVINYLFLKQNLFRELENGLVDPETFKCFSTPEEIFVLYRREEIDALNAGLPVSRLHFVGTDMYTKYYQEFISQMDDAAFAQYLKYHFFICEREDMTGISHHTLDILIKENR